MQVLELLIFAALAAVVLYQLYAVLGRRVGRQPEDQPELATRPAAAVLTAQRAPVDEVTLSGLAAVKSRDPAFDVEHFLQGARGAYELIVRAFVGGDRAALAPLVSPDVMKGFETAIAEREAAGRTETVEFLQPVRADVEESVIDSDAARIKVRFLGEFRSRSKGPEGEAVDDRRTAEMWTFQRPLSSRDPNWILVRVEAAEA
ncbi:MAG TPA: TIM44-related membrane protein TimA [Caulobacteraceae bacterium]|nr:TIM44-related membrane protein TimA [Caulobacteraceae bacterium]